MTLWRSNVFGAISVICIPIASNAMSPKYIADIAIRRV